MEAITILGLLAGLLTTSYLLPQVIKTWKDKKTEDLSLLSFLILIPGNILWLVYGLVITDFPLIAANSLTLVFSSTILFFKLKYM